MVKTNALHGREILLELIPIGSYMRVTAFDVESMTEVSIQGPKNAMPSLLKNNALRRLEYVLRKNKIID